MIEIYLHDTTIFKKHYAGNEIFITSKKKRFCIPLRGDTFSCQRQAEYQKFDHLFLNQLTREEGRSSRKHKNSEERKKKTSFS